MILKFAKIKAIFPAVEVIDGAGVKLKRYIGNQYVNVVDPFLLLDEFKSSDEKDWIAGFPSHPHRGFQTLTYMISGKFEHKDSTGSHSILLSSGLQLMNAGSGVIHSEMPAMEKGFLWGFQLWINLPRKYKMSDPFYFNFYSQVEEEREGIKVIDLVGKPMRENSFFDLIYKHIEMEKESEFKMEIPKSYSTFIVVSEGKIRILPEKVIIPQEKLAVIEGNYLWIFAQEKSHIIFASAPPIREPIARWGPFVMNTKEEIIQAIEDYQSGRLVKKKAEFSQM
jgi:Pirin-related protein